MTANKVRDPLQEHASEPAIESVVGWDLGGVWVMVAPHVLLVRRDYEAAQGV